MGIWDDRPKLSGRPSNFDKTSAALDVYLKKMRAERTALKIWARIFWQAAMRRRKHEKKVERIALNAVEKSLHLADPERSEGSAR